MRSNSDDAEISSVVAVSTDGLPVVQIEGTDYYAVYIIKTDVVYTAFTKLNTHLLVVVDYLKVLIETFEETIKSDLCHEIPKRPEVNLVLDLLVDFSIPLLPSKNILMTFLQQEGIWAMSTSLLSKNTDKLYQKVMNKAVDECRTNDDAFWHPHLENIVSFNEECLLDHDEYLTGIIDDSGVVQSCEIMGKVDVDNKSSQVHNISFQLQQPTKLESYSLHACAKKGRKRFEKDNIVSFTPGINKFTAVKYILNPFTFALPFEMISKIRINEDARTLKVRIILKSAQVAGQHLKITDFIANVHFPKYLSGSSICATDEKSEFLLDEKQNIGKWTVGSLKSTGEYEINGSFFLPTNFSIEDQEVDIVVNINFDIQAYIVSGASVESIKLRDKTHPIDVVHGLKSTTHVKDLDMRITVVKE